MRTLSTALLNYLSLPGAPSPAGSRAFVVADLFEFTVAATTYYFTNYDVDLTGVAPATVTTYTAGSIVLPRIRVRQSSGLQVDDLEITVGHGGTATLGGKTWVRRALDGDLDGAMFKTFRAFITPPSTVTGAVLLFSGEVASLEPASTSIRLVANVPTGRFNTRFPTMTVQPNCVWDLGSTGCGWGGTLDNPVTLAAGSTDAVLQITTLPTGSTGSPYLFFQGGAMLGSGYRRSIIDTGGSFGAYTFTVSPPFPAGTVAPLIGVANACSLRRGCNKTIGVCDAWYSNSVHFLGAPQAPSSQAAK